MRSSKWMMVITTVAGLAALLFALAPSQAGQPSMPRPALMALSGETQSLYKSVRGGIVRIQLPPTHWPAEESDQVLDKWKGKLDPEVLRKLEQEQTRSASGGNIHISSEDPATAPATQPSHGENVLIASIPPRLSVRQRMDGGIELGAFSAGDAPYDSQVPSLSLNVIGVLIDDKGHVLVPLYIDPAAIGDEPVSVRTGEGEKSTVKFVGSDRPTNLTVFKLTSPVGNPVRIAGGRPDDGALVMVLSPAVDSGRLTVWTGGQQDRGIVVTMDGGVAGFARYGQFLIGAYAQPVINQLIQHGHVRRATLGVLVEETEAPDGRRAMRIDKVIPDTVAEKAGLREDDFILSMAGTPVADLPSFAAAIAAREGETKLEIQRGERTFEVTVVLAIK